MTTESEENKNNNEQTRNSSKKVKPVPDVSVILETLAAQVAGITADVAQLLPHKDALHRNASFLNLQRKISQLHDLVAKFAPRKREQEPMRTASAYVLTNAGEIKAESSKIDALLIDLVS